MDVRSLTIQDADRRVADRISKLSPEQQGYLRVSSLDQNGKDLSFEEVGYCPGSRVGRTNFTRRKSYFQYEI